jgi:3-hydroxyisobutyrate dehydrogenase/glyoxylate/succinic semialdehyde reductase
MAVNAMKAESDVYVWNRSKVDVDALLKAGCKAVDSLPELAMTADVVFTMLSTPEAVADVATSKNGLLDNLRADTLWVDCSTVNPSFSRQMGTTANAQGIRFIDAPVSGSTGPAEKGELVFLVGGNETDINEIRHLFDAMGRKLVHAGSVGAGTSLKMVVNLLLGHSVSALAEATGLGLSLGIDRDLLLDFLLNSKVVAPAISGKKRSFVEGQHEPGFPLKYMHKDLHLAHLSAYEVDAPFVHSAVVEQLFQLANNNGYGEQNFTALYEFMMIQRKQTV